MTSDIICSIAVKEPQSYMCWFLSFIRTVTQMCIDMTVINNSSVTQQKHCGEICAVTDLFSLLCQAAPPLILPSSHLGGPVL